MATSATLLDHIITNDQDNDIRSGIGLSDISDYLDVQMYFGLYQLHLNAINHLKI